MLWRVLPGGRLQYVAEALGAGVELGKWGHGEANRQGYGAIMVLEAKNNVTEPICGCSRS